MPQTYTNEEILRQTVPEGRVAYVTAFRVNILNAVGAGSSAGEEGIPPSLISTTILRNGNADAENQNIQIEPLDDFLPCFLIAAPGDIITIEVTGVVENFATDSGGTVEFLAHLQGDLLLENELPFLYTALKD